MINAQQTEAANYYADASRFDGFDRGDECGDMECNPEYFVVREAKSPNGQQTITLGKYVEKREALYWSVRIDGNEVFFGESEQEARECARWWYRGCPC